MNTFPEFIVTEKRGGLFQYAPQHIKMKGFNVARFHGMFQLTQGSYMVKIRRIFCIPHEIGIVGIFVQEIPGGFIFQFVEQHVEEQDMVRGNYRFYPAVSFL